MTEKDVSNGPDLGNSITIGPYTLGPNSNQTILPPIINSYYDDDSGSGWLFSSHDIPILIGAAAGAIGLIIIFLAAALIWHCCQFALQREKSSYSLDNDSERNSISSRGSNLYVNNSIDPSMIFNEKSVIRDLSDQNLKRSISAPIHRDNCALQNNSQKSFETNGTTNTTISDDNHVIACDSSYVKIIDDKLNPNEDSVSIGLELNDKTEKNEINLERSHLYITEHNQSGDITAYKSKSLPWNQSNKRRTVTIDEDPEEFASKISFSKKRRNRMRNDSAAAIAMNRSGGTDATNPTNPTNKIKYSHKDTDTLVDNEAIVVYDERTAL